ncbi:MAG: magnesium transporter [Desulfobacterales bacterium]|uniref:Magnesium transporter MgtE n=1 Tax=Candidatus Desulfatibia vada TaxID=2841696 RepID=A0A8J6P0P2_9BACT|nr:magnesium transporter [Candidatus Desulfatibia vada]MBL6970623.1 magnesium transporter [Desulfobacterales bacterium]
MFVDRTRLLIDNTKKLLRRGATGHLNRIISKTHPADLAGVFHVLSLSEQKTFFDLFDSVEKKAMLFSELKHAIVLSLIEAEPDEKVAEVLEQMSGDDVADLLGKISDARAKILLDLMTKKSSEAVEGLLGYDPKTAGGIMITDFIALKKETTAKEAVEALQKEYVDIEMPFYLYVVDDFGHLIGVISLRQLVVVHPDKKLKSIMDTDVVNVQTDTDQEEVARIVAHYNILAVPVVDENKILVGIVTVDDVIDIIHEEATEDILKMAGGGDVEYIEAQPIFKRIRRRLPWLLASWIGGIIACYVVAHFEQSLNKLVYLATFMPIIMGMGGNVGTQTSASIMRGLATGRIDISQTWRIILKELTIGFCLGFFYGVMLSLFAQFKYGFELWGLGLVVGFAMICSMTLAATLASSIPLVFYRFRIDPAVATGPFVTTFTDILSVFFYFKIATLLLHL